MLDLGTTWLATVSRDPAALAIIDGDIRLSYLDWHQRVAGVAAGFAAMGLTPGDHLVTLLETRWEAATVHWAAQLAGLVYTPLDIATGAETLCAVLEDCAAAALVYQPQATAAASAPYRVTRIALGAPGRGEIAFDDLLEEPGSDIAPQVGADFASVLFYVDHPTGARGVPRRHRAQRAAAFAHVAHNQYAPGERILGALQLTEEPGLRALVSAALVGGAFVCQRRFDPARAASLIERERISALQLRPEMFAALLDHPDFPEADVGSVRRLCIAGARLPAELVQRLDWTFRPLLCIGQYGSAEAPLCAINRAPLANPASAGRAGYTQLLRVMALDAASTEDEAAPNEVGHIMALLQGDDAFDGYWRRPDADHAALRDGWFMTGDLGYFDASGELYVTGRARLEIAEEQEPVGEPGLPYPAI